MDLVLRAAFVFAFMVLLTRVIGKRELGSLQPFDLILLIILGDALQQGLTQDDYSLTGAVLVVGTIAVLQVGVSWLTYRFPRTRPVFEGEPLIVVEDGKVDRAEPEARAAHGRGGRRGGPAPADRPPLGHPVGDPRDERPDQLHPEEALLRSPLSGRVLSTSAAVAPPRRAVCTESGM